MSNISLNDRVYGCMIGGAVGDAMGFPQEGFSYEHIRKNWGIIDSPRVRENCENWNPSITASLYTDDTVMKHMVCEAIFNSDGRITIEAVADVWRAVEDLSEWTWWCNTKVVITKLKYNSLLDLRDVGRDSIPCNDAAMIVGPIGIVNAGDPYTASLEAWNVSELWQHGYSRECAAAMAAAHAEALSPNASVDSVIDAARRYSPTLAPYIDKAVDLAVKCAGDIEAFTAKYYESYLEFPNEEYWNAARAHFPEWCFGADPLEVCTEALAFFKLANGDPKQAIIGGASFGRDCDTIAGIAGALCGAINGWQAIPSDWIEIIVNANPKPDIKEYSQKLYNLMKKNITENADKAEAMKRII